MSSHIPPISPFVFLGDYTINVSSINWVRWNVTEIQTKVGSSVEVPRKKTYILCHGSSEPIILDDSSPDYEEDLERLENVLRVLEFSKLHKEV